MVSGSSLSASHAYSSTTVSPWKVRGLGIFLASGGSIVMRAQSNDAPLSRGGARLWHHGSRARTPAAHELPGGRAHSPQHRAGPQSRPAALAGPETAHHHRHRVPAAVVS